ISTLGILPFLGFFLLRAFLSAHSRVAPQIVAIVAGNALNALLDWLWVFGRCGCPELGIAGSAWATVVRRWLLCARRLWSGGRSIAPPLARLRAPAVRAGAPALEPLWRLLRLGAPIGGQFLLEMGVFALTLLLIGQLDAAAGAVGEH